MEALADRRLHAIKDGASAEELSGAIAWWLDSGEFEIEWSLSYLKGPLEAWRGAARSHSRRVALAPF